MSPIRGRLSPHIANLLNHEVLSTVEETALFQKKYQGCDASRQKLLLSNFRLVFYFAEKRCGRNGVTLEDLLSVGMEGLTEAVERFQPGQGSFPGYARFFITHRIRDHIDRFGRGVLRVPRSAAKGMQKLIEAREELRESLRREPTAHEVAAKLNWSTVRVERLLGITSPVSLDALMSTETTSMPVRSQPVISNDCELRKFAEDIELLHLLLDKLSEREAFVINARYGIRRSAMTLEEIARQLAVSYERIRQIELQALKKLRLYVNQMRDLNGEAALAA